MKVEMGKKYRTKSGLDVELIGVDFTGCPVAGIVKFREGGSQVWHWSREGFYVGGLHHDADLVEATEPPAIPEGWTAWHGGECPVYDRAQVEIICRDGVRQQPLSASAWTWNHNDNSGDIIAYRVVEPKYRPFQNVAEYEQHRDRWLIYKDESLYRSWCYDNQGVFVGNKTLRFQWKYAFEVLKFDDGTPFGVRVE
jgi:hypothetical protein